MDGEIDQRTQIRLTHTTTIAESFGFIIFDFDCDRARGNGSEFFHR